MARLSSLLAIAYAIVSATAQEDAWTTSESNILSIFAIDTAEPLVTPTISASIISADGAEHETVFWVGCTEDSIGISSIGRPPSGPCNYLRGASLTINPSRVMAQITRESLVHSASDVNGDGRLTTEDADITVEGTAFCEIHGSTSASCTGDLTSSVTVTTYLSSSRAIGSHSSVTSESISTEFTDVADHYVPVTITAGLEALPTSTTPNPSSLTGSTGAAAPAALVTGVRQVAAVGAAALAGGVVLF